MVNSATPASQKGDLLYVTNRTSGIRFLADTGVAVSILPPSEGDRVSKQPAYNLLAANGTPIATYSTKVMSLNLGLKKRFTWPFVIAEVTQPILGYDCLHHHDLVVDARRHCLRHLPTNSFTRGSATRQQPESIVHIAATSRYLSLLQEFPTLTSPETAVPAVTTTVQHHIVTTSPLVFFRPRRLPPERLKAAKEEFADLLKEGIIRPSSSCWASPLHMVPKRTAEEWRACGDYRALNNITISDRYPVPHIQDFHSNLHGARVFFFQNRLGASLSPDSGSSRGHSQNSNNNAIRMV